MDGNNTGTYYAGHTEIGGIITGVGEYSACITSNTAKEHQYDLRTTGVVTDSEEEEATVMYEDGNDYINDSEGTKKTLGNLGQLYLPPTKKHTAPRGYDKLSAARL